MDKLICMPTELFLNQNQYDRLCAIAKERNNTPEDEFKYMMMTGSKHLIDNKLVALETMWEKTKTNNRLPTSSVKQLELSQGQEQTPNVPPRFDSLEVAPPVLSDEKKPPFDVMEFNEQQWEQIKKGWDNDLDVSAYANPAFRAEQMEEIRLGLGNNTSLTEMSEQFFVERTENAFSIYQLKGGDEARDLRFEPYDRLQAAGRTPNPANYELTYTTPLENDMTLEGIFEKFNVDRPADFTGHSLSVSDVIVLHQKGQNTAHYVDSFGYRDMPEFLKNAHALDMEPPQRLFVDMDGTLAVFKPVDTMEMLYQKGYFANLTPIDNVVQAVKQIIKQNPNIEVFTLSACLSDSKYALDEKNAWLDRYLPEVDAEHRVFPPCGQEKTKYVPGGLRETDFLLDDYTKNLNEWEPPARGIKLLNGINHTRGTWQNDRIRYDKAPQVLANSIMAAIQGQEHARDEPFGLTPAPERSYDNFSLGAHQPSATAPEHSAAFPPQRATPQKTGEQSIVFDMPPVEW